MQRQLLPITTLGFFELGLAVPANSRLGTLKDLLAHARSQPGRLTIGTIAVGSTQHLSAELFKARTGIDAVVVPYKGSPAVINALRTGEIDVAFEILSPLLPQLKAGTIRLLAVTGTQRFASLPEVPPVMEQGVADYSVDSWNALAAPAGAATNLLRIGGPWPAGSPMESTATTQSTRVSSIENCGSGYGTRWSVSTTTRSA